MIGVDGPEPKVKIGEQRRDLVLGKIHMIIDGTVMVPLYLDSKLQNFEMPDTSRHTLQVADYLATILIDGIPIQNIDYGGLPIRFKIGNKMCFIRFTTLPKGVSVGKPMNILPPPIAIVKSPLEIPTTQMPATIVEVPVTTPNTVQNPLPPPIVETNIPEVTPVTSVQTDTPNLPTTTPSTSALPGLNIEELYQRLISSGIIGGIVPPEKKPEVEKIPEPEPTKEEIHFVNLRKPETIKKRSAGIVDTLFTGMQCSSCGVRFPPEQTMKYSQHLDWHFRQNRRERDASKKAHSRKWYYDVSDWIQYEEIEDLEEREKNWFEKHGMQAEIDLDEMEKSPGDQVMNCPAGPKGAEETCEVCHDKFEYFFNEDIEEWQLKNAVRLEEKAYHPTCYDDLKAAEARAEQAMNNSETDISKMDESNTDEKTEDENVEEKIEKIKSQEDVEDDDDVIVLPPQNPIITEILDDDDDEKGYRLNDIEDTSVDSPKIENMKDQNPPSVEEYTPLEMSQIRVKEEPMDESFDDNHDDVFEDVGTIEASLIDDETGMSLDEPIIVSVSSPTIVNTNEASNDAPTSSVLTPVASTSAGEINLSMNQTYGHPHPQINKIRINITKQMGSKSPKETDTPVHSPMNKELLEEEEEIEEPEPEYEIKPQLRDVKFKKLAPSIVGCETSGLCCIM